MLYPSGAIFSIEIGVCSKTQQEHTYMADSLHNAVALLSTSHGHPNHNTGSAHF